jgi:hypothetical protein
MPGTAQRRTNRAWEVMRVRLEASLAIPQRDVRRALQALDDAVIAILAESEESSAVG